MRIRSRSLALPALLFLHGGPGVTDRASGPQKLRTADQSCTLVCWDQRGCGKSFTPASLGEHFDIDTFVEDARQVTEYDLHGSASVRSTSWATPGAVYSAFCSPRGTRSVSRAT
ncbi:MAG: alpha/beta fold hydrolase [Lachnospiraceae bacterium]